MNPTDARIQTRTPIRVGVIGAGRMGKIHIENILYHLPGVHVRAVATRTLEHAGPWLARHGIETHTTDYREILEDPAIDVVVIASSTGTHAMLSEAAAKAGKAVFCEKPIDHTVPRAREVLEAVKSAGIPYQVGFNRRFDHNFRRARDLVAQGHVGRPHTIQITSRDATYDIGFIRETARTGGLLFDMAVHDFDMARYLVHAASPGVEVTEVFCRGQVLVDPAFEQAGDVDTAITCLRFADGTLACVDNSRRAVYGYDQRLEVFGSAGCVRVGNDQVTTTKWCARARVHWDKIQWFFLERYQEAFLAELRAFFQCLRDGSSPPVTGTDCLHAMELAAAARTSMRENRVVRMETTGKHGGISNETRPESSKI